VGQISKQLAELTNTPFSANTTTNSKEQCKSIVIRSGKEIGKGIGDYLTSPDVIEGGVEEVVEKEGGKEVDIEKNEENNNVNNEKKMKKLKKKVRASKRWM
jgi:hypothetical protein